ncbi:hypothetical protein P5673_012011 [Acropora cervicornis]|uniref:BESS domain-containing protein n=1 Tax=Acropora cervicornis TaxID=6130 RepID=A0AAD9V8D4_ACRCE|nr:hypothetical protein P5673_012011 [Acropora cervicornis]
MSPEDLTDDPDFIVGGKNLIVDVPVEAKKPTLYATALMTHLFSDEEMNIFDSGVVTKFLIGTVDTLDEGQDLQSEIQETESPDSGSVRERLPSTTRSSSSSPVEQGQPKQGAKVIKKKRAWSSQKSNQDKHTKEAVDMELLKTAKSIAEGLQADPRTVTEIEDEDSFYCKSLATRMRALEPQSKAYVRMQIEQLMFQVQFGGKVSNSSLPEQNVYLPQGPYSNPSHCNRQGLLFGNSLDSYHLQNLIKAKTSGEIEANRPSPGILNQTLAQE